MAAHHSKSNWSFGWENEDNQKQSKSMCEINNGVDSTDTTGSSRFEQNKSRNENKNCPEKRTIQGQENDTDTSDKDLSSNMYADGSNQNCGNFITDRPTT